MPGWGSSFWRMATFPAHAATWPRAFAIAPGSCGRCTCWPSRAYPAASAEPRADFFVTSRKGFRDANKEFLPRPEPTGEVVMQALATEQKVCPVREPFTVEVLKE